MQPFPAAFRTEAIQTDGATLHVRSGGHGPAVILLHGYGETGDMWAPLAAELARDHTVVVPDLRGMGLSSRPEGGYDRVVAWIESPGAFSYLPSGIRRSGPRPACRVWSSG